MDSIIAIFKEILKHGKETNNSRTVFFTIMVIILLLNSYLIDNLSIKQFFISNSMKVLINLSEFLFHGYFDVIVFYIIWITLSFVISSKVDPYFYNVISFLFRYIKIMWRLSTDCFLIIFLYMMLFFGRTFIESLTDLSTTHNMVITDDNHTKIIVLHATEGLGFLKDGEIGLIYILLIFNILFSVGYVLFRLFRRNENINL